MRTRWRPSDVDVVALDVHTQLPLPQPNRPSAPLAAPKAVRAGWFRTRLSPSAGYNHPQHSSPTDASRPDAEGKLAAVPTWRRAILSTESAPRTLPRGTSITSITNSHCSLHLSRARAPVSRPRRRTAKAREVQPARAEALRRLEQDQAALVRLAASRTARVGHTRGTWREGALGMWRCVVSVCSLTSQQARMSRRRVGGYDSSRNPAAVSSLPQST